MTPREGQSGLASRAREIEELADVYFFRPLGALFARLAAALGATPTQVTIFSMLIGVAGGALLFDKRFALLGFALLIFYSVLDSTDGQLARMTGQVTEFGRVLDGVGGYVVYVAIYIAITAGLLQRGHGLEIITWAALAAISNTAQAQMYEYHRHHYATIVVKGRVVGDDPAKVSSASISGVYRWYLAMQRMFNGPHVEVESAIAARAMNDVVREQDREKYRKYFYGPVRGWNLLGDNTRFYAIGVAAGLHRIDLFFAFILVPMNLALIAFWIWQRRADQRFLATI
ncbi:MAG: CDP-alcohol phosphatidyltransferase family protein [Verrucomicrobiota bacterium]|nr:CDP-alcohol phosphatidyltransferase family protein [Verrucomicrobiota bacterium]